jgi:hypothetical protein
MKLSGMASRFKKRQAIHVRSEHDVQKLIWAQQLFNSQSRPLRIK